MLYDGDPCCKATWKKNSAPAAPREGVLFRLEGGGYVFGLEGGGIQHDTTAAPHVCIVRFYGVLKEKESIERSSQTSLALSLHDQSLNKLKRDCVLFLSRSERLRFRARIFLPLPS